MNGKIAIIGGSHGVPPLVTARLIAEGHEVVPMTNIEARKEIVLLEQQRGIRIETLEGMAKREAALKGKIYSGNMNRITATHHNPPRSMTPEELEYYSKHKKLEGFSSAANSPR